MREPTRYVTLTVMVSFDGSGNSSTRMPLASVYSVMPSTEAVCFGAAVAGRAAGGAVTAAFGGGGAGVGAPAARLCDPAARPTKRPARIAIDAELLTATL